MSYRARKLLSVFVLAVGLPAYVAVAATLVGLVGHQSLWVELPIYVGLGVLWAVPLRRLFRGIGRPDPEAERRQP